MKIQKPMGIIFGNESKGINEQLLDYTTEKITIPKFGNAESLNVAISVAIVCDNFRRLEKLLKKM